MNKTYKTTTNAKGNIVVASEKATTGGNRVHSIAVAATTAVALLFAGSANAATGATQNETSIAVGDYSTALGQSQAQGNYSVAIGNASAQAANGIAIGQAITTNAGDVAIGNEALTGATATNKPSVAVGNTVSTGGDYSVALGSNTTATGAASLAIGMGDTGATASGTKNIAIGSGVRSTGEFSSIAIGKDINAQGNGSIVIGEDSAATDIYSTTIGRSSSADGNGALTIGNITTSKGEASTAISQGANADGVYATAVGAKTTATGSSATALGSAASATAESATATGAGSKATASTASAYGEGSHATGDRSTAIGTKARANTLATTAVGSGAVASGNYATALGTGSAASNAATVAVGLQSKASGSGAVGIGRNANATEDYSVALGSASTTVAAVDTNEATVGNLTYRNFAGNDATSVVSVGTTGVYRQVQHIAAGQISQDSTDAINGSQLFRTQEVVGNIGDSVVNLVGGQTTMTPVGVIETVNLANTGKTNVHEAIIAARTEVTSQDNSVTINKTEENGKLTYDLSVEKYTFNGSDAVEVSTTKQDNQTTVAVDLSANTKADIAKGVEAKNIVDNKGLTFATESGQTAPAKLGDTVQITGDDNIDTEATPNGIVVKLKKDITADSLTTGNTKLSSDGLDNGGNTIKNVASGGDTDTNGANIGDVKRIVNANATRVTAGDNVTVESEKDENGVTTYKLTAKDTSASVTAASNALTVTPAASVKQGTVDVTDYAVDLSASSKASLAKADTALQTVVSQINGQDVKTINQNDNTFNFTTGDNIVLENKDGAIQVSTAKDLKADSFTTNEGGVSISSTGLNNGGQIISNVASGGDTDTNAANIGDVKRLASAGKPKVAGGKNVSVSEKVEGDVTTYTINATDTTASVSAGSNALTVTKGQVANVGNAQSTDFAVDLSAETKSDIAKGVDAHGTVTTKGISFASNSGTSTPAKLGDTVSIIGGDSNIQTAASGNEIKVSLSKDLNVDSVKADAVSANTVSANTYRAGDVTIAADKIDAANNRINNVADGVADTDAANVGQLKKAFKGLDERFDNAKKDSEAGTASAIAVAGLMQAYEPNQNAFSASFGQYQGQSALAIGASSISDSGKWGMKFTFTGNTQGKVGGSLSGAYYWH